MSSEDESISTVCAFIFSGLNLIFITFAGVYDIFGERQGVGVLEADCLQVQPMERKTHYLKSASWDWMFSILHDSILSQGKNVGPGDWFEKYDFWRHVKYLGNCVNGFGSGHPSSTQVVADLIINLISLTVATVIYKILKYSTLCGKKIWKTIKMHPF